MLVNNNVVKHSCSESFLLISFQSHSQLQPPCRQLSVLLSHSPGDVTQSPVHGDGGLGQPVGSLHHAGHLKRTIVSMKEVCKRKATEFFVRRTVIKS